MASNLSASPLWLPVMTLCGIEGPLRYTPALKTTPTPRAHDTPRGPTRNRRVIFGAGK